MAQTESAESVAAGKADDARPVWWRRRAKRLVAIALVAAGIGWWIMRDRLPVVGEASWNHKVRIIAWGPDSESIIVSATPSLRGDEFARTLNEPVILHRLALPSLDVLETVRMMLPDPAITGGNDAVPRRSLSTIGRFPIEIDYDDQGLLIHYSTCSPERQVDRTRWRWDNEYAVPASCDDCDLPSLHDELLANRRSAHVPAFAGLASIPDRDWFNTGRRFRRFGGFGASLYEYAANQQFMAFYERYGDGTPLVAEGVPRHPRTPTAPRPHRVHWRRGTTNAAEDCVIVFLGHPGFTYEGRAPTWERTLVDATTATSNTTLLDDPRTTRLEIARQWNPIPKLNAGASSRYGFLIQVASPITDKSLEDRSRVVTVRSCLFPVSRRVTIGSKRFGTDPPVYRSLTPDGQHMIVHYSSDSGDSLVAIDCEELLKRGDCDRIRYDETAGDWITEYDR